MYRRVAYVLSLLACLVLVATLRPAVRTAWAEDELEAQVLTLYDVSSDGRTHVTLQAHIVDNDPATTRRGAGAGYYYTAFRFIVHAANAGLVARAGGSRLDIETI